MDDHDDAQRDAEHEPADRVTQSEHGFQTADPAAVQHAAFFDMPTHLTDAERRARLVDH